LVLSLQKSLLKKNILEIGWRKTSGSNVFKNVGALPGALTGICDILKGSWQFIWQKSFGFSLEIQSLCAFFAVLGHNWSIFLKFAGGRGIGTFMGCLLILAPKILFYSLIPFLLFTSNFRYLNRNNFVFALCNFSFF
jgi:glycerol-3-phosphate acyltransferase PlsY